MLPIYQVPIYQKPEQYAINSDMPKENGDLISSRKWVMPVEHTHNTNKFHHTNLKSYSTDSYVFHVTRDKT